MPVQRAQTSSGSFFRPRHEERMSLDAPSACLTEVQRFKIEVATGTFRVLRAATAMSGRQSRKYGSSDIQMESKPYRSPFLHQLARSRTGMAVLSPRPIPRCLLLLVVVISSRFYLSYFRISMNR